MNETIEINPNEWTLIEIGQGNTQMYISCISNAMRYSFYGTGVGIPTGNTFKVDRDIYIRVNDTSGKQITITIERL